MIRWQASYPPADEPARRYRQATLMGHGGIRALRTVRPWQATRPILPPPRVVDVVSRLLAIAALIGCVAVAGVGALR